MKSKCAPHSGSPQGHGVTNGRTPLAVGPFAAKTSHGTVGLNPIAKGQLTAYCATLR